MTATDSKDITKARTIVLVFFNGCPHVDKARRELQTLQVEFTEICQDDLEENDSLRNFSSPTVIFDGRVVLGAAVNGAASCSYSNDVDYGRLRAALLDR